MRTYVSTMGFHETRVTRPVLRHGLDGEDRVVLLTPEADTTEDRTRDAVDYVEDMLHEIAPGVTVTVEPIPHSDFSAAVFECCELIEAAAGDVIVNFGGGAREIFLPLTIAAILDASKIETALQYTDVEQSVREWAVPNLTAPVPTEQWPTLETVQVEGPNVSIPELDDALDTSKSTISRHLSDLASKDLVTTTMRGKTKHVSVTLSGRLLLQTDDR
jgi:CRISPR-associated protein Csa3